MKYQRNPLRTARVLAYVSAAMHDALVHASRDIEDVSGIWLAVHRSACLTASYFHPQEPVERFMALDVAMCTHFGVHDAAWQLAEKIGQATIARSRVDGAGRAWSVHRRPPHVPGQWRPTPPIYAFNPSEPLAGEWKTWALRSGSEIEPPPPPALGSEQYIAETEEVYQVAQTLTREQKDIAEKWDLNLGTVTPGGVWNIEALRLAESRKMDDFTAVRMLAALNVGIMDALIACWHAKFKWWGQRPISVIRERYDPEFMSHVLTPSFPTYVSGHATASGAAATVLAHFFPNDAKALHEMAEEAATSRLYGGIHFRSDDEEGLSLGGKVGARALAVMRGKSTA